MPAGPISIQEALRLHQAGDVASAACMYEQILHEEPNNAGAWHLLGVAFQQQGRVAQGADCIQRALTLDDTKAVYHNNYAVALRALGRLAEARQSLDRAIALQGQYADAHSNLGLVLRDLGDLDGAMCSFRRALDSSPAHKDAQFNLAGLLQELGRHADAISLYEKVIRLNPHRAGAYNNLGNALLAQRRVAEAIDSYEKATLLDARCADAHLNLGMAYSIHECVTEAERAFGVAAQLRPDKALWRLRSLGLCPTVFQTVQEIDDYRSELEARLDDACRARRDVDEASLAQDAFVPSFNLAHHGRSNRRLLGKFAALFTPHIRKRQLVPRRAKPRVGFLFTTAHLSHFLRTRKGLVDRLDPHRFQTVILCSADVLEACRQRIERQDIDWIAFPSNFSQAADRVASAACDLIYYHKVSADPLGYLLPFARLSRVQCTSWSTHFTSGVPEVDYYLSSALVETEDSDAEYTEKLVRLATLPACEAVPRSIPRAKRSDFSLPEQGGLYLAPQRLAKFHPAQDELFRGVLEADPAGHLVLLAEKNETTVQELLDRFQRTLGPAAQRVIVLPKQPPEDFRRFLSVGDALLDIHHYSASLMGYDAFAMDLPIVTLPGRFKVERYALGFYRQLGLTGAVAASPQQYVDIAVRLGTDKDYRDAFRIEIGNRKHRLFDDISKVRDFEQFVEDALRAVDKARND